MKMKDPKNSLILILLAAFLSHELSAQPAFTRILEGDLVNTASDSRSVNFVDVNNDGWEDVFISNGPSAGQNNMLYLNNEGQGFTTIIDDDIVLDNGKSDGASFADVDNDGDLDAVVVTWHGQRNFFFRNNGDGTFTDETDAAPAVGGTYSETASWGDYDQDGYVDLMVTNSDGSYRNQLYHNEIDGSFSLVSGQEWLIQADLSRCVSWTDFDLDGDLDLFITNENNAANDLLRNDGDGQFTPITEGSIVQTTRSSMSASWGDIDNDGDLDVFIANAGYFQEVNNQLFRNDGDGTFTEITTGDPVTDGGCSYGSAFADADNDGDLDLLVTNGFCNNHLEDRLYINDGQGGFTYFPAALPDIPERCSFGAAFGDIDRDGFLDLVIANCKNNTGQPQQPNSYYHNDGNNNHWLTVRLEGTQSNRSAIGAKVRVKATINGNEVWQIREITAQSGYCGQNSLMAHFGLGDAAIVDSIWVQWPSGQESILAQQPVDDQLNLLEDISSGLSERSPDFSIEWTCNPNPVKEELLVSFQWPTTVKPGRCQLILMDSLGRMMYQKSFSDHQEALTVDLHNYVSGRYQVILRYEGLIDSRQIIKL